MTFVELAQLKDDPAGTLKAARQRPRKKVVYIAGRFRGSSAWAIAENIRRAERVGFSVAQAGAMPLIPHANTANFHGTLTDEFWLDGTLELLRRCDAVLTVAGWEDSEGAKGEVAEARLLQLPIFHGVDHLALWLREREQIERP